MIFIFKSKVAKFDIGDVVEVKYKYPRPQNAIQKQLVGKKLKGRVINFHVRRHLVFYFDTINIDSSYRYFTPPFILFMYKLAVVEAYQKYEGRTD